MDKWIDLADVAEELSKKFPRIHAMYLFGSRGFGTGSPRSDIDILLESEEHIRPATLREFAIGDFAALDLFVIDGGRAVSAQNESYIEAANSSALIATLKATPVPL